MKLISFLDSDVLTIALVGYSIVFFALILLFFIFNKLPSLIKLNIRNTLKRQGKKTCAESEDGNCKEQFNVSGEVNAAIGLGLYMYFQEVHDIENTVITIKKVSKRYSPWSSKLYSLTQNINREPWSK